MAVVCVKSSLVVVNVSRIKEQRKKKTHLGTRRDTSRAPRFLHCRRLIVVVNSSMLSKNFVSKKME